MSVPPPAAGRATLAHGYRNLSEREIRARLEAPLGAAERTTAKAELLRRGAGDDAPDTALASGFAATSVFGVESSSGPDITPIEQGDGGTAPGRGRLWPWIALLALLVAGAAWAMRSTLVHLVSR